MYYYKRIRDLREDNDKNQSEVAKYLNITQQQYSLYERGEREIKIYLLIKLADYYNVSLDYITERTNNKGGIGCQGTGAIEQQNNNYGSGTQINVKK